jgi:hypothetical protein
LAAVGETETEMAGGAGVGELPPPQPAAAKRITDIEIKNLDVMKAP